MSSHVRCEFCGHDSPAGARACARCGKPLAPIDPDEPTLGSPLRPPERSERPDGAWSPASSGRAPGVTDAIARPPVRPPEEGATRDVPGALPQPGSVVGGRYEVRAVLARGGMGSVVEAWDRLVQEEVAIKFMHPELVRGEEEVRRFVREGRLSRMLNHPNVVRTMNIENDGPLQYIVMERLRGKTLRDWMTEHGPALPDFVSEVGDQCLAALEEAQRRGVVHRDIKPQNVWVAELPDGRLEVKITDFGLAKMFDSVDADLTQSPRFLGTPAYMAPEQATFGAKVDHRADLFSLGTVLHELFTGQLPGGEVSVLVPEAFRAVLARALSPLAEQRFTGAAEMREAWQDAVRVSRKEARKRGQSWPVPPGSALPAAPSEAKAWGRAAMAAVLVAAIAAALALLWAGRTARLPPELAERLPPRLVAWLTRGDASVLDEPLVVAPAEEEPAAAAIELPRASPAESALAAEAALTEGTWAALSSWLAEHPDSPDGARVGAAAAELTAVAERQAGFARAAIEAGDLDGAADAILEGRSRRPDLADWTQLDSQLAELAAWQRASEARSLASMRRFLEAYPESARAADARALLSELEREAAADPASIELDALVARGSTDEVGAFARGLPEGPVRERALSELRLLGTEQSEAARRRAETALGQGSLAEALAARDEAARLAATSNATVRLSALDARLAGALAAAVRAELQRSAGPVDAATREGWRARLARGRELAPSAADWGALGRSVDEAP